MSKLSQMYGYWKDSIKTSMKRYDENLEKSLKYLQDFYSKILKDYIINWSKYFENQPFRHSLRQKIESFFGKSEINFVAIDGTCIKDEGSNFITFFAGAYGARGKIIIKHEGEKIKYERWDFARDVTMMAQIPVYPYEIEFVANSHELSQIQFYSDKDVQEILNLHTSLMKLAEIYLAYHVVSSSTVDMPQIILLDLSPSTLLRVPYVNYKNTNYLGYEYLNDTIKLSDAIIALSHPYNKLLGVPSRKKYRSYALLLSKLDEICSQNQKTFFTYQELAGICHLSIEDIKEIVKFLNAAGVVEDDKVAGIKLLVNLSQRWSYLVSFFDYICNQIFIQKNPAALEFSNFSEESKIKKLISHDDISFLISIGIRALIEKCWEKNVFLIGIVKDSKSRYFCRNFLNVLSSQNMLKTDKGNFKTNNFQIAMSDRLVFENCAALSTELCAPWSSVEFDSAFTTLFVDRNNNITGVKGHIVADDRIFAKSIAQFYLQRSKKQCKMGHAIFVERLLHPALDRQFLDVVLGENSKLGRISPFIHLDKDVINWGQAMNIYFLDVLTRNHFPEVIGYPEPLHKADRGAKTLLRFAKGIIQSSQQLYRKDPLNMTFRKFRDSLKFDDEE